MPVRNTAIVGLPITIPVASAALGISIHRAKLSVFVITSMLVSFAGCLGAYYEGVVTEGFYDLHLAIAYLAMIIVGGLGSVLGSILGAFLITLMALSD